ncbi:MAG: hypothetical protein KY476_01605 [Planctomycetes bacterium]|nr:hypothetical protein [Planctomycetota bacterium]
MQRLSYALTLAALAAAAGFTSAARAEEGYGSVTGRFVLEGDIPEPRVLIAKGAALVKDPQVCAAKNVLADDLVVDEKTRGIANVFVYMSKCGDVHPSLAASEKKEVVFDQKGCVFIPHALFVRTDQEVVVKSDDPVSHNTHTYPIKNDAVNFIVRPNDRVGVPVAHATSEILPIEVKCDIHTHMRAYWLILDHPYAAVTDETGKFTIDKLPVGEHSFRVWHERVGYIDRTLKVTVTEDGVDLGEIKVPVARFAEE